MKKTVFLAVAVCCAAAFAQLQQSNSIKTVHGKGRNADYRTAVYEALVQAASQVQGVSLQDSRDAFVDSMAQLKKSNAGDSDITEIRESLKQSVSAKTKGRVLSYDLTEERFDKDMGLWYIELDAKVPGQYVVGLHPDNRRRLVVMPFRSLSGEVSVYGQKVAPGTYCEEIARRLNEDLTQTRRFTMLDREFGDEVQAELSRLNLANASAGDFGRFQQLLVTDYMVVGTVKLYNSPSAVYNQYTGRSTAQDGPFIEVNYKVILVPTSQLKWAGTIIVPYSQAGGATVDAALSSAYMAASADVCAAIIDNIYPPRITAKTTYELVINQGGKNIHVGDVFDVLRRGEEVIDVSSGESLGAPEELVARIRVTRVTPKMSYAVVADPDGTPFDQIEVGAVVRRPSGGVSFGEAPGAVSPVQVSPGGAVKPPWQK